MAEDSPLDTPSAPGFSPEALVQEFQIINRKGLHARASAKFVQCAERFNAEITVMRCGETVGGTSIMGLLTLAASQGTSVTVGATGLEAREALAAIETLLATGFGEED
jgi:phosphocarrier protein HPr